MKILCLIPARSGSKGIPHKNIRSFKNKPLIVWSIQQALSSKYKEDMKIVVTTDSEEYRKIAIECGAEAPFLRPPEISKDESGKSVYFKSSDYLHHLDKADGKCWMGAFPFCNGSDFASEASKSKRIHATWGSVDESPVTGLEALFELPSAIAQDYRVFRILSRAIEANTL